MPNEQTLSPYEPRSWREQLAYALMGGNPSLERRHLVQGLLGTTGLGQKTQPNVLDAIPVASGIAQMQEAYPNQVDMAKSTLGFMPPSPYGLLGGQANNIRSQEQSRDPNKTFGDYANYIRSIQNPAPAPTDKQAASPAPAPAQASPGLLDTAKKLLKLGASQYGIDASKLPSASQTAQALLPQDPYEAAGKGLNAAATGDYSQALNEFYGGLPATGAIRAWHGSPHAFDKFDISKIGTGEGAQVYGHGLYFAENPDVAKEYQRALSHDQKLIGGVPESTDNPLHIAASILHDNKGDRAAAINELDSAIRSQAFPAHFNGVAQDALAHLQGTAPLPGVKTVPNPGHLYEVNLDVEPHQLLDWHKPINEQSDFVKQRLSDVMRWQKVPPLNNVGAPTTGGQLIDYLERRFANKPDATAELSSSGVPGLQYLDQGSRTAGEGSRNYVMFSDQPIGILGRY